MRGTMGIKGSVARKRLSIALAGALIGALASGGPAQAASTYAGDFEMTLTVLAISGSITLTAGTSLKALDVDFAGNPGTVADAVLDRDPLATTPLSVGDAISLRGAISGATVDGPLFSEAASFAKATGVIAARNNSAQFNAAVNFSLDYSLSGSAAIDNVSRDTAFLRVLLQTASLGNGYGAVQAFIDLPTDGMALSDAKANALLLTLIVPAGGANAVIISGTMTGKASTQPVPLPTALPLFAAGVAAVGLAAHRRERRT
jgi:hypothetical protein